MINPMDYLPHGLVGLLAGTVGVVYKQHVKQDDERFKQLTDTNTELSAKLDAHYISMNEKLVDIALAVGARTKPPGA